MNKNRLFEIKQEIEMFSKNWNIFSELSNLEEVEAFLNSSEIGEIITFIEIKNTFEENKVNFNFKKVKAYMQEFFIVNAYTQTLKKLFALDQQKFEKNDNKELFNQSVFLKNLIKLYLMEERKAEEEVFLKTKDNSVAVNLYIDKKVKEFMIDCFLFIKTFVK